MNSIKNIRTMVVTDDPRLRKTLEDGLEPFGMALTASKTIFQALKTLKKAEINTVLLDSRCAGDDPFKTVRQLKRQSPSTQIIMLIDPDISEPKKTVLRLVGAFELVDRECLPATLLTKIKAAWAIGRWKDERARRIPTPAIACWPTAVYDSGYVEDR